MSKAGFENEQKIKNALEGKKFRELNGNLKKFVNFCVNGNRAESVTVRCYKVEGQHKSDLKIEVGGNKFSVSVKSGGGNSIHQESVESFIDYLGKEFNVEENLKNSIRCFIWGDNTLNGKGEKDERMNGRQISQKYPPLVQMIKKFFEKKKKELIERFLLEGSANDFRPNIIYYGDDENGLWAKSEDVIKFLCKPENRSKSVIPIGALTFQAWNRAIRENSSSEKKRGVIQVKWPSMKEDMEKIMQD